MDVYFRIIDGVSTMDTLLRTDIQSSLVAFKQYSLRVTEVSTQLTSSQYEQIGSGELQVDYKIKMLIESI